MVKFNKSEAAKVREVTRATAKQYCPMFPIMGMKPCYTCRLAKGESDCKGNPIGNRDRLIAISRSSVVSSFALGTFNERERDKSG